MVSKCLIKIVSVLYVASSFFSQLPINSAADKPIIIHFTIHHLSNYYFFISSKELCLARGKTLVLSRDKFDSFGEGLVVEQGI